MAYTTIKKPSDYFNTKLYTGNGSTQSITGLDFQPDWVWIKQRDIAENHMAYDAVRGAGKTLSPDGNYTESTNAQSLQSFNSDGFTLGNLDNVNKSSGTYASWNWLGANGTASNTDGSITSTVSANTTSGFSIVSYTGTGSNATIGHGIDTPAMIIVKNLSSAYEWGVYHKSLGATQNIYLDSTGAAGSATFWNNTEPTSSVFNVGNTLYTNGSGQNYIAYCFAEKTGYSKFGSYTGNGNADGTFIYTGFKPAFLMAKRTDVGDPWVMIDNKRNSFNALSNTLLANSAGAEDTGTDRADFISNGIKIKTTSTAWNASGGNYIYMAFAEEPLVGDNPATAR